MWKASSVLYRQQLARQVRIASILVLKHSPMAKRLCLGWFNTRGFKGAEDTGKKELVQGLILQAPHFTSL
jgi:hypothetical protein